jgi:hypothetical protein
VYDLSVYPPEKMLVIQKRVRGRKQRKAYHRSMQTQHLINQMSVK